MIITSMGLTGCSLIGGSGRLTTGTGRGLRLDAISPRGREAATWPVPVRPVSPDEPSLPSAIPDPSCRAGIPHLMAPCRGAGNRLGYYSPCPSPSSPKPAHRSAPTGVDHPDGHDG